MQRAALSSIESMNASLPFLHAFLTSGMPEPAAASENRIVTRAAATPNVKLKLVKSRRRVAKDGRSCRANTKQV
eukprot:scaffold161608_cov36-Prasinocladus_malaysianus.AAC.1